MKANIHNRAIPANIIEQAQEKIAEARALLKPYLIALTPADRQELPKMGPKTLNFVEKSHTYAKENPELVPPYLNMAEFDVDFADAHSLWALCNNIRKLEENVSDTQMISGSESFQHSLTFYNSAKAAASKNILDAKTVYEDLKKRFPCGKKRPKDKVD